MGHARNYLTIDILRRVLEDYFGERFFFIMNITDVDDKIIKRARVQHLQAQYANHQLVPPADQAAFAADALAAFRAKADRGVAAARAELEAASSTSTTTTNPKLLAALVNARDQAELKLAQAYNDSETTQNDALAEALDKAFGHAVTDPEIFRQHALKYERSFLQDMQRLGVRPCDAMPRVSEHIPEIVDYIQVLVHEKMLAYEVPGDGVYFDTAAFGQHGGTYGKLAPWAVGNATLASEGEVGGGGSSSSTSNSTTLFPSIREGKKNPADFALWKASKPGEPAWPSPWGEGRPGWHIECSAMAAYVLGGHDKLDIHSGGHDLRFPHHTNEIAQAEAYHGCDQWVDLFLHTGHLNIEGLKMSKSLKNFVSIQQALETFSPRQLRLLFLLQPWDKPMVYGEHAQSEMKVRDSQIKNFFANIAALCRTGTDATAKWQSDDLEVKRLVDVTTDQVHAALCDNIDTRSAMNALGELIRAVNTYITHREARGVAPLPALLKYAAQPVRRFCRVVGLFGYEGGDKHDHGDGGGEAFASSSSGDGGSGESDNSFGNAVMDVLASFRDQVRNVARETKNSALLAICDVVRDEQLVEAGVRLEDKASGTAIWKREDAVTLRREAEERRLAVAQAARLKVEKALATAMREHEKLAKLALLPDVVTALSDKYRPFDLETGPTHDAEGNELDDKAKKKGKKDVEKELKVRGPLLKAREKVGGGIRSPLPPMSSRTCNDNSKR